MYPGRPYPKTLGELVRISAGEAPILACAPQVLRATARGFLDGFPGLVTYAVKANPDPTILENLSAAGVAAFDVASVPEIELLRAAAPQATLHYNNPVRASAEIRRAVALGVKSFSLDSAGELARLRACVAPSAELSVRFKLEMPGAAYDFGAKFGAQPDAAVDLLRAVRAAGFAPSLTFHPGTQCAPIEVWQAYVAAAARIAGEARVEIKRLNVGGGFPARRMCDDRPRLEPIFSAIETALRVGFGTAAPEIVCEPGRAMVAESCALVTRVRALRGRHVFLNDGIYGGLAEMLTLPMTDRVTVLTADGDRRLGPIVPWTLFGPTCDSLDRLPGEVALPADLKETDAVLFHGMGAYSGVTATRFNGFGALSLQTVQSLSL